MDNNLGSYNYGAFSSNSEELQRLRRQAEIAWAMEEEHLMTHGLQNGDTVADLACGPGIISGLIKREVCPDGLVIGVELNKSLPRNLGIEQAIKQAFKRETEQSSGQANERSNDGAIERLSER